MTLKKCSCGQIATTKNAKKVSRNILGLWFTCKFCDSTMILKAINYSKYLSILIFLTSCAPPKNDCKKIYQEVYVNCKPLPLGQSESCDRKLAEICEDQYKLAYKGVSR